MVANTQNGPKFHSRSVIPLRQSETTSRRDKENEIPLRNGVPAAPLAKHSFHSRQVIQSAEIYDKVAAEQAATRARTFQEKEQLDQLAAKQRERERLWYNQLPKHERRTIDSANPQEVASERVKRRRMEILEQESKQLEQDRLNRWYLRDNPTGRGLQEVAQQRAQKHAEQILAESRMRAKEKIALAEQHKAKIQDRLSQIDKQAETARKLAASLNPRSKKRQRPSSFSALNCLNQIESSFALPGNRAVPRRVFHPLNARALRDSEERKQKLGKQVVAKNKAVRDIKVKRIAKANEESGVENSTSKSREPNQLGKQDNHQTATTDTSNKELHNDSVG